MPTVKNWQLGREMSYPYDARYPSRQFAFVFNINRCIACQSCTMACKSTWTFSKGQEHMWWANVETKPYGGYPQWWDAKILEKLEEANPGGQSWSGKPADGRFGPYGKFDGQTVFEAAARTLTPDSARVLGYLPTDEEWNSPNIYEDNPVGKRGVRNKLDETGVQLPVHNTWFFYLARICNHCSYPACLAACPRKAIYKRPEDGIVLLDQAECRGYRKCVEACPYKKSMYRGNTRTSEKCIGCYPRVKGTDPETGGEPMETRCMAACIGQIRMQGLVQVAEDGTWAEDRQQPALLPRARGEGRAAALSAVRHAAQRLLHPAALGAAARTCGRCSAPASTARSRTTSARAASCSPCCSCSAGRTASSSGTRSRKGPKIYEGTLHGRKVELFNDTVIAFGKDGRELFRTTVEEPVHVRPNIHANSI